MSTREHLQRIYEIAAMGYELSRDIRHRDIVDHAVKALAALGGRDAVKDPPPRDLWGKKVLAVAGESCYFIATFNGHDWNEWNEWTVPAFPEWWMPLPDPPSR